MREPSPSMFTSPNQRREASSRSPVIIAASGIAVVLVAVLLFFARHHGPRNPNARLPLDPHAASLSFSRLVMSESTSLSGGRSTFLDGHVKNTGSATVTGVRVQVFFNNAEGMPPHLETLPLTLIRTREPYVDTQPVGVAPLHPGEEREFRLIFESIPDNWNTQLPDIHVVSVSEQ